MRWAHPNRHNHYRVQQRGRKRKRCKLWKHWKVKYETKTAARDAAFFMTDEHGEEFRDFECRHCGYYHVGRPKLEGDFGDQT